MKLILNNLRSILYHAKLEFRENTAQQKLASFLTLQLKKINKWVKENLTPQKH